MSCAFFGVPGRDLSRRDGAGQQADLIQKRESRGMRASDSRMSSGLPSGFRYCLPVGEAGLCGMGLTPLDV